MVAAAATFLSEHYGAPVMLFALLLGMAMNFLSGDGPCAAGIEFTGRTVLRVGVALLGLRITLGQVAELGWQPLAIVVVVGGADHRRVDGAWRRLMGFQSLFGLLSGGATAICGASAALALAAALPNHPLKERATLFTVIGVSALSTLAMIVYPMIAQALGLDPRAAGVFLGATIHDVAQVVGAGYSMSAADRRRGHRRQADARGDAAAGDRVRGDASRVRAVAGSEGGGEPGRHRCCRGSRWPSPCWWPSTAPAGLPPAVAKAGSEFSRWCLVAAIAGIGMKTQLKELATVGFKPVAADARRDRSSWSRWC